MIVLYPGSFDPLTLGHMDIIDRASRMFEKVYVAVLVNKNKKSLFPIARRLEMLSACVNGYENVVPLSGEGLIYDLAESLAVDAVLRGLRGVADYVSEQTTANALLRLKRVETVFMEAAPEHEHVSSSIVREILSFGGSVDQLVPGPIRRMLYGE